MPLVRPKNASYQCLPCAGPLESYLLSGSKENLLYRSNRLMKDNKRRKSLCVPVPTAALGPPNQWSYFRRLAVAAADNVSDAAVASLVLES